MRIAHVSDFHYTHLTWNPFRLLSKRILGNLNWLFLRKKHFFEEQVEPLPALFKSLNVDLILFGGDFTTTSLIEEFEKAGRFVKKCHQPWIAIPGNHDKYTKRSQRSKHFYRYFANKRTEIAHPVEFFTLKDHAVEAHRVAPHWWIIALDTALATNPYSSEGLLSEKLESHLEEVLKLIPPNDSIIMLNHYPFFQNDVARHNLKRGEALQQILQRHPRIRLYLHGHTHRHTIADLQLSDLPIVLDSGSCAQGRKGAWNLIDLKPHGCTISTYRWDHAWTKTRTEEFPWTRP
ncbi:MAG TPA: metallophosphoesterase [Chlamydiales bacterium]|nr:metallophosphoesterase [Chlamydiales bacterium]